jgi:hypothetical protein
MEAIQQRCVEAYRQHQSLKVAAQHVGIPWQTVYVHLRKAGEPVIGDKLKYGSETDRLAAKAERLFLELVPFAVDQNSRQFQSKVDFLVGGLGVDVKAARLRPHSIKSSRWMFSIKKQEAVADFFVCLGFDDKGTEVETLLLVPGEIARKHVTISHTSRRGKWSDYRIKPDELAPFFDQMLER